MQFAIHKIKYPEYLRNVDLKYCLHSAHFSIFKSNFNNLMEYFRILPSVRCSWNLIKSREWRVLTRARRHLITTLVKSTSRYGLINGWNQREPASRCPVTSLARVGSAPFRFRCSGRFALSLSFSLSVSISLVATGNPGFRCSGGIHAQPSVVTPRIHESMDPPSLPVRLAIDWIWFRWYFRQRDDTALNLARSYLSRQTN